MSTRTLLHDIVHCPHVRFCLENPSAENPCREIVASQGLSELENYHVPEPWSGRIEQAPLLFLSSNPSISFSEDYPSGAWSDDDIEDYFNFRFGGGRKNWIINGTKSLQIDGTYSRSVRFWIEVRQRAIELLGRDAVPGIDYTLTEIVHCKSHKEIGVKQAQSQCVEAYLLRVLALAAAKVVVVLGTPAKRAIQAQFNMHSDTLVSQPIKIGNREKRFAFLPHPNARCCRSFAKCLQTDELEKLRNFLH